MKKLMFILFVMIPFFGNAQFFDYSASVETGYFTGNYSMTRQQSETSFYGKHPAMSFYSDLNFNLHFFNKQINIKNNIETTFTKLNKGITFSPLISIYTTSVNYNFKNQPIKIGFKHGCTHTIEEQYFQRAKINFNSTYNKVYIKLKIK